MARDDDDVMEEEEEYAEEAPAAPRLRSTIATTKKQKVPTRHEGNASLPLRTCLSSVNIYALFGPPGDELADAIAALRLRAVALFAEATDPLRKLRDVSEGAGASRLPPPFSNSCPALHTVTVANSFCTASFTARAQGRLRSAA